jgi:predicted DNA-binding protein (MmcQ/YjbR family)
MPGIFRQRTGVLGAADAIRAAVAAWPGTHDAPHRFGGVEFRLGDREIGHLHGDHLLDVPFPRAIHDELIAAGRAEPHHVMPQSGWISFRLSEEVDVDEAIAILRRSYDLISAQLARRQAQSAAAKERRAG